MKIQKIIYWIATGFLSVLFLFSASMYLTKYAMVKGFFISFGYPTYIIYPLAIAKILGVIGLLTLKTQRLKEWIYAGFFFDLVLAFFAHVMINDGSQGASVVGLLLLIISYTFNYLIFIKPSKQI